MIFYKPFKDNDEIKKLFPSVEIDENKINGAYVGFDENNNMCGKCMVEIDGYNCTVKNVVQQNNDKEIIEGLLRAALNFAGNRNAFTANCSQEDISDVLFLLGFKKENGVYKGEIPTLLMGSCCKNKGEN